MKGKRARSCIMYRLQYNDLAFGIKNKEEEEEKSRLFTKRESKLTQSEAIHTNRQQVNLEQLCTSLSHCLRICVYIRCLYTTDGRTDGVFCVYSSACKVDLSSFPTDKTS